MTAPANNDRPSDTPKPPEGYPGWLETIIWCQGSSPENRYARAELSALRAKAAAYDAAMQRLKAIDTGWADVAWKQARESISEFIRHEIASGRFKP